MINRLIAITMAFSAAFAIQAFAQNTQILVKKTNGCGCCLSWMKHLEDHGFEVIGENLFGGALVRYKLDMGIPPKMVSCHTATVEGYIIEGHVPANDIKRLLSEKPDAVGLAVPGMPYGSPGMGSEEERESYDVFLIRRDGSSEMYSSYDER